MLSRLPFPIRINQIDTSDAPNDNRCCVGQHQSAQAVLFAPRGIALEYAVVLAELLIALSVTFVGLRFGRTFSSFLFGVLLGMAWTTLSTASASACSRLKVITRSDPGGLIGFGIVAAILPGIPLGVVVGAVLVTVGNHRLSKANRPLDGDDGASSS